MITVVHGYVVLYLTIFETLIILKIDGSKENCHKDGISTICSKIISFRSFEILYCCNSNRNHHTGKCKSTGASCNALVKIKLRTGVRLKWRKR